MGNTFRDRIEQQMERYRRLTALPEGAFTIGAFVLAVLSIHHPEEAEDFWLGYLAYQKQKSPASDAESICRSNIGWCFAEGMSERDKAMWIDICDATHPWFGRSIVSGEEAFRLGVQKGYE